MSSDRGKIGEMVLCPATEGGSQNGYSSVEWRIAGIRSYAAYCGESFKSDSFECVGMRWHIKIKFEKYDILAGLVTETSLPSLDECIIQFKLGLKKANGTIIGDGRWSTFSTKKTYEYSLFCFNRENLERRRTALLTSGVITFVCSFKSRGLHDASQLASAMEIVANPQTVRNSAELVDASTQTLSENSNTQTVRESAELSDVTTQTQSENCTEKLSRDLSELLLSGEDTNLTVQVKGVEFHLHRGIMGVRTPVFGSMLRHDMTEKSTGVVCVNDCEVEVFREFVHYAYSGRVTELNTVTVFGLFALADKYQVEELKSSCFEFIRGSLSVDTFCDVVTLALAYSESELLLQATDFFAQNMEEILKTVQWMDFMKRHMIQANELIIKGVQKIYSR